MRISNRHILICTAIYLVFFCLQLQAQVEPPVLNRVHIEPLTQNVNFTWEASPTPAVTHYVVYKYRYTGNNPFPSRERFSPNLSVLEFTGPDADVQKHPVGYSVKAFIGEDSSDDSNLDSTIHLSVSYDSCTASAELKWNDYNTWRGNILHYTIYVESGGVEQASIDIPGDQLETTLYDLTANKTYEFIVTAFKNSGTTDDRSSSNRILIPTMHAFYPLYIYANYGTVGADNHPEMQFSIDPISELTNYVLFRSETSDNFTDSIAFFSTNDKVIEYVDNVDASLVPYYYQLAAKNFCNSYIHFSENIASTIHLTAQLNGYDVNLSWNAYKKWNEDDVDYEIQRAFRGGNFESIDQTTDSSFTDNSLEALREQNGANEVCYRIIAHERPGKPYPGELASSSSNIACVQLPPMVIFADDMNAFAPVLGESGPGRSFGPTVDFIPIDFKFKIYNRWGNLVFKTTDAANPHWDGSTGDGNLAPEGVYRYQLQYVDEYGKMIVIHGNVTVVRQ